MNLTNVMVKFFIGIMMSPQFNQVIGKLAEESMIKHYLPNNPD